MLQSLKMPAGGSLVWAAGVPGDPKFAGSNTRWHGWYRRFHTQEVSVQTRLMRPAPVHLCLVKDKWEPKLILRFDAVLRLYACKLLMGRVQPPSQLVSS